MKILAITLARGGSKGIKGKNLYPLAGKPLIQYTFDIIPDISRINKYIVSTDDTEIQAYCFSSGIEAPFLRPALLSSDTATSAAALKHAVLFCEQVQNVKFDIIVELMCTNPFKNSIHVDQVLDKIIQTGADSVIGISPVEEHHPARIKYLEGDFIKDFLPESHSRRQDLRPYAFVRNGSIYAMQRDLLVNFEYRFGGSNSRGIVMTYPCNVNIDSPLDILVAESILATLNPSK